MSYDDIVSAAGLDAVFDSIGAVHGAYQAVDVLRDALDGISEPDGFDKQLQKLESRHPSYEGPDQAGRVAYKTLVTAKGASEPIREALLKILSLMLGKLTVSQSIRLLGMLVTAAGTDPTALVLIVRLCLLLSRTSKGKQVVAAAQPQINRALAAVDKTGITDSLVTVAERLGDGRDQLLDFLADGPSSIIEKLDATSKAADQEIRQPPTE